jgi:hypothetical protein
MPEYTFYKIVCKNKNIKEIYIGKTTNFKRRVREHKRNCYNENYKHYNYKVYLYIRENGGWDNFDMIEIETNEYDNKDSAFRERYWIEELNANLNLVIPLRTDKEWYINNKEFLKEKKKEYHQNNKKIIKEYYENNKKIINEKCKKYYEKNKEIINQKRKEKIMCECGCEILKSSLSRHLKTKKHIDLMS